MGCAKSKEARCVHCKKPFFSRLRSPSSFFHRGSLHKGDNASVTTQSTSRRLSDAQNVSVVSPSSNTSGIKNGNNKNYSESPQGKKGNNNSNRNSNVDKGNRISTDSKGKADYNKTNKTVHQPKVVIPPTRIPSGKAETINTLELMEGLEDNNSTSRPNYKDSNDDFSFPVATDTVPVNKLTSTIHENDTEPKPMWHQMAANDSILSRSTVSDFDPKIVSTFRKTLEELSPSNAPLLRSPGSGRIPSPGHQRLYSTGSVRAPSPGPQRLMSTGSMDNNLTVPGHDRRFSKDSIDSKDLDNEITASKLTSCGENKVLLYFTSLRGVRKTYEDCCHVKVILKGLGAKVDERDVSMHFGFREELRQLMGSEGIVGKLPRVFVKGKYIGGAEELRQMHEDGDLEKVIEGCEMVEEGSGGVCETCGDTRFVLCDMCSGSCKIFIEGKDDDEEKEENEENAWGFQRCPYCNENGIVRCSSCCSS